MVEQSTLRQDIILLEMYMRKRKINISYLESLEMLADPLTKPLSDGTFERHVYTMGLGEQLDLHMMDTNSETSDGT